jgi:hypothetical protein
MFYGERRPTCLRWLLKTLTLCDLLFKNDFCFFSVCRGNEEKSFAQQITKVANTVSYAWSHIYNR